MQAIQQIPGIGDLTACALVAAVGNFSTFKSARQFASWVGLTPRQVGTGGETQQLGISERGDTCLRTLLIAGARAVIARAERSSWITRGLPQCSSSEETSNEPATRCVICLTQRCTP